MSLQDLFKALTIVTQAGKHTPRFEGKPSTKGNITVFIKGEDEYSGQMRWDVSGEMPRDPVGVIEFLGWS